MIRAHFGLAKNPFCSDSLVLLAHQQQVLDTLRVHCQQGGLCVIVGEPGTGKSVIKQALCEHDPKRIITPVVNRTLHTYHSTLRILCEAFQLESDGADFRCEKRLVEEARRLNSAGKMLAPIIDDAHLMEVSALRKIRLLFEDFPKNHCLVLVAQPELLSRLSLTVNEDIKNCVTYSVLMQKLAPDTIESFIRAELDKVALSHSRLLRRFRSRIATSAGKSTSNPMSSILKPFTISNRSLTPSGESQAAVKRTVSARYPGHVWNIDITVVPLGGGLWCPVLPFSWPMLWPFCWHVAAIVDHF